MRRVLNLYRSTVGKKAIMAVSGAILFLYVFGHMLGNLKVFLGPEHFNEYAHWLREMGAPLFPHTGALWIVRIVLLAAVVLHIWSATELTLRSWSARDVDYEKEERISFSYASYTMRWGGVVIFLFVVYHLLHLTWGWEPAHGEFVPGDAYHNVVAGFSQWPVSAAYIVAMIVLGFHLYHGLWSALQTLGVNHPKYNHLRRPIALVIALVIVLGFLTVPVGVLAGVVS